MPAVVTGRSPTHGPPPCPGREYPRELAYREGDLLVADYLGQEEDPDAEWEVEAVVDEAAVGDLKLYLLKWKVGAQPNAVGRGQARGKATQRARPRGAATPRASPPARCRPSPAPARALSSTSATRGAITAAGSPPETSGPRCWRRGGRGRSTPASNVGAARGSGGGGRH
jgi:hypothetical protein